MNIKEWLQGVLRATFALNYPDDPYAEIDQLPALKQAKYSDLSKKKPKARKKAIASKKLKKAA
jgi:hypothetical protein